MNMNIRMSEELWIIIPKYTAMNGCTGFFKEPVLEKPRNTSWYAHAHHRCWKNLPLCMWVQAQVIGLIVHEYIKVKANKGLCQLFGAMCSNGKGRNKPALIKQQWPLDKNECAFVAVLIWVCLGLRKHELESLFCKIQQIQIKRHIEELKMYFCLCRVCLHDTNRNKVTSPE